MTTTTELERFFGPLIERRKVDVIYREQMHRMGFYFNACNFILYEAQLTDVFKDLLDPGGTHGQGPVFLASFLSQLEVTSGYQQSALPGTREIPIISALRRDMEKDCRQIVARP